MLQGRTPIRNWVDVCRQGNFNLDYLQAFNYVASMFNDDNIAEAIEKTTYEGCTKQVSGGTASIDSLYEFSRLNNTFFLWEERYSHDGNVKEGTMKNSSTTRKDAPPTSYTHSATETGSSNAHFL
eukprot:Nk52_evm8s2415 gene=Nk52_evmTU8s2415